jgi:hypothetical protein
MKLRALKTKDRFYAASDINKKELYEKMGACEFNPRHGSSTCKCFAWNRGVVVSKSCNLEVILAVATSPAS